MFYRTINFSMKYAIQLNIFLNFIQKVIYFQKQDLKIL
jgi:hypothetical protein